MSAAAQKKRSKSTDGEPVTIKVTMRQLIGCKPLIHYLFGQRLNGVLADRFRQFARQLNQIHNDYEKKRVELCAKFGPHDAEKNEYIIPDDKKPEWEAEYQVQLDEEWSLKGEPLTARELGQMPISTDELIALDWFIK